MEITIGCDPELLYLNQDRRVVPARSIVQNAAGPNGCDGCSDVGEYRPGSGRDNAELVDKIRKVMRDEISREEEDAANAALIAAAPDLLYAAQVALRLFPAELRGSILEQAVAKAEEGR